MNEEVLNGFPGTLLRDPGCSVRAATSASQGAYVIAAAFVCLSGSATPSGGKGVVVCVAPLGRAEKEPALSHPAVSSRVGSCKKVSAQPELQPDPGQ